MGRKKILTCTIGQKFGKLTVQEINPGNIIICACSCGGRAKTSGFNLMKRGQVNCLSCKWDGKKHPRAKYSSTPRSIKNTNNESRSVYQVWQEMRMRCSNKRNKNYCNYGGRGIKVCKEWYDSFDKFYCWATKSGYKKGLSIDRIDNNQGYSPNNCRWSTRSTQNRNTRRNLIYQGQTASQASLNLGGAKRLVDNRLRIGWSIEKAFTTPIIIRTLLVS